VGKGPLCRVDANLEAPLGASRSGLIAYSARSSRGLAYLSSGRYQTRSVEATGIDPLVLPGDGQPQRSISVARTICAWRVAQRSGVIRSLNWTFDLGRA
jgi:hypothetical protein